MNGENVGGMTVKAATALLRSKVEENLKGKQLKIAGEERVYTFAYPEISYKDDFNRVLASARRNRSYTASVSYYLCGLDEALGNICEFEKVERVEPRAQFNLSGEPFEYFEGNDGRQVDFTRLKSDVLHSLCGGFEDVSLKYLKTFRRTSMSSVREQTALLGSFTTRYDSSNVNRSSNIRLAAELLNGVKVDGGKTFSFNDSVGARLPERGFLPAKIIENGEFSEGVGGGVCQVSTTLYNAALLSGMTVTEYHPHSLSVSYVEPSRDAMVSGSACDLKFRNPSAFPLYIRSHAADGLLTFELYGKSDGAKYSVESVVTGDIEAKEEFSDDPSKVREGRAGLTSEGYLIIDRSGYVKRIRLRADRYLPISRIVLSDSDQKDGKTPSDGGAENISNN